MKLDIIANILPRASVLLESVDRMCNFFNDVVPSVSSSPLIEGATMDDVTKSLERVDDMVQRAGSFFMGIFIDSIHGETDPEEAQTHLSYGPQLIASIGSAISEYCALFGVNVTVEMNDDL